jgi:hypothetical protein
MISTIFFEENAISIQIQTYEQWLLIRAVEIQELAAVSCGSRATRVTNTGDAHLNTVLRMRNYASLTRET